MCISININISNSIGINITIYMHTSILLVPISISMARRNRLLTPGIMHQVLSSNGPQWPIPRLCLSKQLPKTPQW